MVITRRKRAPYSASRYEVNFPVFILTLTAIQSAMYILRDSMLISDKPFVFYSHRRYEVWRYFTLVLVHDDLMHLFQNSAFQLYFGMHLEAIYGWKPVGLIYLSGTLFGELAASSLPFITFHEAAGASASVNALIAACVSSAILNPQLAKYPHLAVFMLNVVSELGVLITCKSQQSLVCRIVDYFGAFEVTMSSLVSHSGGTIAGILVGISVLRIIRSPQRQWKLLLKRVCCFLAVFLLTISLYINVMK